MDRSRKIGLARVLSKAGYCSRSRAAELIRSGRVAVNGRIRRDPEAPVNAGHDHIFIDGEELKAQAKIYLMLNKPRGLVTSTSDEKGRETIYGCVDESLSWLAPVGRLDKASEGLLLLTNDSEWGARVVAPETHLAKTYHVQIGAVANDALLAAMMEGVTSDGEMLRAGEARFLRGGQRNSWIEIVVHEGRNRHLRRMLSALDVEVLRLVRVAIGPQVLGDLKKGSYRELSSAEKMELDAAMKIAPVAKSSRTA